MDNTQSKPIPKPTVPAATPPTPQPQPVLSTPSQEIGYVRAIKDYLVWIEGLPNIRINQLVESQDRALGMAVSVKDDLVEILMLNNYKVRPNDTFTKTSRLLSISAGDHLLGRAIDPLGQPIDGKSGFSKLGEDIEIETPALGIKSRDVIKKQFETGTTLIDMLTPLAFGQRELIIGDAHSGKTSFLIDTIVSQSKKDVICIYAMIGKPVTEIKKLLEILKINNALEYTAVIATSSSDKAPLIFITPSIAMALAQYFQKKGKDVLVILDDLGIHAKFYREISLLSNKPPGRDSYPGDIFYTHSKIIEKAGSFAKEFGGGSITALPILETHLDDFTSFMSTNLMGMTDGHLLFSSSKYKQGIKPAVDIFLSVSRVGRQTQSIAQKILADKVKTLLSEGEKLEAYSRLGSELSSQTQFTLKQTAQIQEILKQPGLIKIPIIVQMILLGLIFTPFFSEKDLKFVQTNKQQLINYLVQQDLKNYQKQVVSFKDDKEFIDSLKTLIPSLEKVCQAQKAAA